VTTLISEILNLSPIKFVKYTTMNILSQLTKARFALKRKFHDLKQVKNHTNLQLEETFKPITELLHELVKENNKQKISYVKDGIKGMREIKQIKKKTTMITESLTMYTLQLMRKICSLIEI